VGKRDGSNIPSCWYCNKRGHRQNNCFKKKAEESRGGRSGGGRKADKNDDEMGCAYAGAVYANVKALVAKPARLNSANNDSWIIDSGASHHLCHNHCLFVNLKRLPKLVMVYLGDNSTISAISAGTIRLILPSRIISIKALFVP